MISSYDRPRSHNGLFYQRNLQSQCTIYLPVQLTPRYFGRQIQRKYPLVLWHMELPLHLCFPVAHSFTSAKQEVLLFGLPFFYIVVFAHERNTEKQSSLINSMIADRIDSNLSPDWVLTAVLNIVITVLLDCARHIYLSNGTTITLCRARSSMLLLFYFFFLLAAKNSR